MIESKKDNSKGLTSKVSKVSDDVELLHKRIDEMLSENKKVLEQINNRLTVIES